MPCAFQEIEKKSKVETRETSGEVLQNRVSVRYMNSRAGMPLKVSSTPAASLLLSSMMPDDGRESNVMTESTSSGTNASPVRGGATVGGVRPIVVNAVETQNSPGGKNIPNATCSTGSPFESRHTEKFSEHRKTINTDTSTNYPNVPLSQHSQFAEEHSTANHPLAHQIHHIDDQHHDTIIKHTIGSSDLSRGRGLNSSPGRTQISAEDERNREQHLGFSTIESPENPSLITRRRGFEPNYLQQQQKHALAALQHPPQPPSQYTATAAQIALGMTNHYGQSHSMGDGSRVNPIISYSELHGESNRDALFMQGKETDEDASGTSATTDTMSPGRRTPNRDSSIERIVVGTPSTASTAPSSDDEALADYKLDDPSILPKLLHPIHQNQGTGEDVMFQVQEPPQNPNPWGQQTATGNPHNPSFGGRAQIGTHHYPLQQQPQQRVASFRHEGNVVERRRNDEQIHQNQNQRLPPQHISHHLYQQQQHQEQQRQRMSTPPGSRKFPYSYHPTQKISTPPRTARNTRQQGSKQAPSASPHQTGSSLQRSSSEVLKTLLRKKACLYEPNTSRAVALVTWLVGRLLALEFGFFSRQQLQSGVHACVSNKIDAGTITRTKVNRCMQIILNSCFHYIIPRSDGSEEKGDYFRDAFAATVQDDSLLLQELTEPWNDLVVDRETVIHAILQDVEERNANLPGTSNQSPSISPRHSPRLTSMNAEKNPEKYFIDGEKEEASKRAVLLCFNENVRSAEDVFRCHNDFIRDTANASHLQLSAQEWSQFFGLEALRDPQLLGNVGVSMLSGGLPGGQKAPPDLLGRMSQDEMAKFRTTWCTKRYEHDHDLCGFAHIEVNGGWLRRNPKKYLYKNEMCKFVTKETCKLVNPAGEEVVSHFYLNECPRGLSCDHAHSIEEIKYHPLNYKNGVCTQPYTRPGGCRLGDVCPHAHPPDNTRPFKKLTADGRSPDKRGKKNFDQGKSNAKSWATTVPSGSPIVYASPAPTSKFEHQLGMPGLQNLFRRQSEVIRAYVRSSGKSQPVHCLFEDKVE